MNYSSLRQCCVKNQSIKSAFICKGGSQVILGYNWVYYVLHNGDLRRNRFRAAASGVTAISVVRCWRDGASLWTYSAGLLQQGANNSLIQVALC